MWMREKLYYCHLIVAASVLHQRKVYLFAYLSDIILMASLADILSFLFMMKKETSSRKCRLKIIKKMRSNDCNRIDNCYSAAQESNSCNFCVSIDSGINILCL